MARTARKSAATPTRSRRSTTTSGAAPARPERNGKLIYTFPEGNAGMRRLLGGKGAGLAEMTNAGLPVPPGFTIQTDACREYMRGGLSPDVDRQMDEALAKLESLQGQKLGQGENPLLVS